MAGALHSNARSIGTRGLNASPVGLARTPRAHQTRLLRETSSTSPRPVARPRRPPVFPATFFLPRRPRASSAPVRHRFGTSTRGRRAAAGTTACARRSGASFRGTFRA
jgi:hypothetical protein